MKYFYLAILLLITDNVSAQSLTYQSGDSIRNFKPDQYTFIKTDKINLYALNSYDNRLFIDIFDKVSLVLKSQVLIPVPQSVGYDISIKKIMIRNDTLRAFYSYFDKGTNTENLVLITFDKKSRLISPPKIIEQSQGKSGMKAGEFYISEYGENKFISYLTKHSRDSTFLNINYFDLSGKIVKTQNLAISKVDKIICQILDNDNNFYLFTPGGTPKYNTGIQLTVYSPGSESTVKTLLSIPAQKNIFVSGFNYSCIDRNNKYLYFMAPFMDSGPSLDAIGMYLVQYDMTSKSVKNEKAIYFNDNPAGKKDIFMKSCIPVALFETENGGLTALFESRLQTSHQVYGVTVVNDFLMGNILSIQLDSTLTLTDIRNIKKYQQTNQNKKNYTGFCYQYISGKTFLIYNELPDNLSANTEDFKKVSTSKLDETVVIYTVVDSGKVKRNQYFLKEKPSVTDAIIPYSAFRDELSDDLFIIRNINERYYLTKMSFETE